MPRRRTLEKAGPTSRAHTELLIDAAGGQETVLIMLERVSDAQRIASRELRELQAQKVLNVDPCTPSIPLATANAFFGFHRTPVAVRSNLTVFLSSNIVRRGLFQGERGKRRRSAALREGDDEDDGDVDLKTKDVTFSVNARAKAKHGPKRGKRG